jgi:hypothetical protein
VPRRSRSGAVLNRRALNRALLARQLLLRRWRLPAGKARAAGRPAGTGAALALCRALDPAGSLWSRAVEPLDRRRQSGAHRAHARDDPPGHRARLPGPPTRPAARSGPQPDVGSPYGRRIAGLDPEALIAAARDLLEDRPRTLAEPAPNVLLSHADRTRIVSDEDRRRFITRNGAGLGSVLVDGFVRGTWKIARR